MSEPIVGVNLQKGGNVSLTKVAAAASVVLRHVVAACGWDVNDTPGEADYDLDMSAAGVDETGKVPSDKDPGDRRRQEWFIYPNHRDPANKSICFGHDNRTGEGDDDGETITVDLEKVPEKIKKIIFSVVIWRANKKGGQRFGHVKNAYIRIYDKVSGQEFARFNLGKDFADDILVMFGELYRHNGEWKFRAIGQGYDTDEYRKDFGIERPFETEPARLFYRQF
jgi:tellurium resistance protein TerD